MLLVSTNVVIVQANRYSRKEEQGCIEQYQEYRIIEVNSDPSINLDLEPTYLMNGQALQECEKSSYLLVKFKTKTETTTIVHCWFEKSLILNVACQLKKH